MNGLVTTEMIEYPPKWSILFAKDPDQDLEFDEGLEDNELYQHKPPRRRPLLWIIILLLAIGVVYWALQPDFSKLLGTDSPPVPLSQPRISLPESEQKEVKPLQAISVPTPQFREGQQVVLITTPAENALPTTLQGDASGTKPGPMVKSGESLTILDGEMVGQGWAYQVRTQSGATGWVVEKAIKKKPS